MGRKGEMSHPAVELDRVARVFTAGAGRRRRSAVAVEELSMCVAPGEVMGLLGPNGAGKSTVIAMISGLITPSSGRVLIGGIDAVRSRRQIAGRVGVVFDRARTLYPRMTARENIEYFTSLRGGGRVKSVAGRAAHWIEFLGIGRWADVPVNNLSMGTQQKVSLAAALAAGPDVVLMDEPTLGLDVASSLDLQQLVRRMARDHGCALVIATHQMDVAESVCDRVCIMSDGRALAIDTVSALLRVFGRRSYRIALRAPATDALQAAIVQAGARPSLASDVDAARGFVIDLDVDDDAGLPRALEAIRMAGTEVESVVRREPCLANVFLEITGTGKGQGADACCSMA
jgi:ABC-2 type transport system ATP-binding protein